MGYHMSSGQFANVDEVVLYNGTQSADETSAKIECGEKTVACLSLVVSAVTSSPTLDVTIQTSADGSTWRTVAAFAQATGAGSERKSFSGLDRFVRADLNIGGTGTITYKLSGDLK